MKREQGIQIVKFIDREVQEELWSETDDLDTINSLIEEELKEEGIRQKRTIPYKFVLMLLFIILISTIIAIGIYFKSKREDAERIAMYTSYLEYKEIENSDDIEQRPAILTPKAELSSDVTADQLQKYGSYTFTAASGITYTFGLDGANVEGGVYHDERQVSVVALNPMSDNKRRIGYFFIPNYGSMESGITGVKYSLAELKEQGSAGFCQLNSSQGFATEFKSNLNPGCILSFFRSNRVYYTDENWDCFVLTFDLDTQEVLDAFNLQIKELDANGKQIEFAETSMSGWWRVCGVSDYKHPALGGDLTEISVAEAAITQHNASVCVELEGTFRRLTSKGNFPWLPFAAEYLVHDIRSSGYAPLILKYSEKYEMPIPVTNVTSSLIAITPLYHSQDGTKVPLITLYGYIDLRQDNRLRFVYIGYTDYNDERCVSLEAYRDIDLNWR